MKTSNFIKLGYALFIYAFLVSCEDFVEIDTPTHRIVGETVFNDEATAESAMQGIYNQLMRADFSGGWQNSITALAGLSSDNLEALRPANVSYQEFDQHEILPENTGNLALWSSAYNIIYMANSIIEGLQDSEIETGVRNSLMGEARFIRAFTYFHLTNLYDEVPLLLTTDYNQNAKASRNSSEAIYAQIILDLTEARELLSEEYRNGERTTVNKFVATALLARVHLYLENWQEAEELSSEVISETGTYEILDSLDQVFLPNSSEALWQISPIGRGNSLTHTNEGSIFIIHPNSPASSDFKLNDSLVAGFEPGDLRLSSWIGYHQELEVYYPFKYKDQNSNNSITEYSMVMRLAEQYLIRSEARLRLNNAEGAVSDLNVLRKRAGMEPISAQVTDGETLLNLIMIERRHELFSEWGHRWFDLKRTGTFADVFASNPLWEPTDVWYPIPDQERMNNPNLTQNQGY
ncbi:RagB/SusD family nutrient uptake outer membrane protein [Salegentibacter sp. UBA1130]|uniref:RagB/SusD family nutrient uptake outer membrane protein n=1 Tax=Salegentibacter sp. UBA1130 TaxID=1947451 RepID=UPI00257AF86D|nr:RagB/SusD family nutrient uptake outer membrane protein [Salegentibacter sp. UBA1130]